MDNLRKRFLAGLLSLVMVVSLLPAASLAVEPEEEPETEAETVVPEDAEAEAPGEPEEEEAPAGVPDLPYCLLVTHSLDVDGETYGKTEMLPLTEEDFRDGVYDIHDAALDREGMTAVKASYVDTEEGGLVESWTVGKDAFEMGGDPEDGSAYYAVQLLIEYEVAAGYKAEPSDEPYVPGEYDAMALTQFTGGNIENIEFTPADVVRLTIKYEYSRTGGMAGASAADTKVIEIMKPSGNPPDYTQAVYEGGLPNDGEALANLRIVLDPAPLNAYVVSPSRAAEVAKWDVPFSEENQKKLESYLENGYFNVQTSDTPLAGEAKRPGPVYWVNDTDHNTSGSSTSSFGNRYSEEYNTAWNNARKITTDCFTASAASRGLEEAKAGANAMTDPQLKVTISETQWAKIVELQKAVENAVDDEAKKAAEKALSDALTLTVYYRRNASFYNVEHWVISNMAGTNKPGTTTPWNGDDPSETVTVNEKTYHLVFTEQVQGRVGALTNAKDSPAIGKADGVIIGDGGGKGESKQNAFDFSQVVTETIAQEVIAQRNSDGSPATTVKIYYKAAEAYRVVFDTNDVYIPRQQVQLGHTIAFDYTQSSLQIDNKPVTDYKNPTRAGYTFAGWGYRVKAGTDGASTNLDGVLCKQLPNGGSSFTLDQVISDAYITNSEAGDTGVKALYLVPMWTDGKANVRVVFWTEDLSQDAGDDAKVTITGDYDRTAEGRYNPDSKYNNDVVTNTSYSNAGSFTFTALTGAQVDLGVSSNTLTGGSIEVTVDGEGNQTLASAVSAKFTETMSTLKGFDNSDISIADFYQPASVEVNNTDKKIASDGTTVINVYYTRKIYTAEFIYYNAPSEGAWQVASRTNGYAVVTLQDTAGWEPEFGCIPQGQSPAGHTNDYNHWKNIAAGASVHVPQRVVIEAKYGADLTDIWPASKGETFAVYQPNTTTQITSRLISWTPISGPYNNHYRNNASDEPTLMGVYSAMGADIIRNPNRTELHQYLYAYWETSTISYYRNNHCYEVPGLKASEISGIQGVQTIQLVSGASEDRDLLYLVPANNSAFVFGDLMKVKYSGGQVYYEGESGYDTATGDEYYAVRVFEGHCYAVATRARAYSSNSIASQNPSARLHLSRVAHSVTANDYRDNPHTYPYAPDHSSAYDSGKGIVAGSKNEPVGLDTNPYDIYFYYTREEFNIIYSVSVTNNVAKPEENGSDRELARWKVPYGAVLDGTYNVQLENQSKTTGAKLYNDGYGDTYPSWTPTLVGGAHVTVCPDRSADGENTWNFGGWYQNRALTAPMTWNSQPVTGNVRLYAKWNVGKYTVNFNLDGGSIPDITQDELNALLSQEIDANRSFTGGGGIIPRPIRDGYTLEGWYVADASGTIAQPEAEFSFDEPIIANVYVAARWKRTSTTPYYYRVWHLTEDPTANPDYPDDPTKYLTPELSSGITPKDSAGVEMGHTAGKDKWYVLGGEPAVITDYKNSGDILWLAASAFSNYVPRHPNHSYTLKQADLDASGTAQKAHDYFFYYDKTQTKKYTLNFVLAGTENNTTPVSPVDPFEGEADSSVLQPTAVVLSQLASKGYQLVKKEADNSYTVITEAADLTPYKTNADRTEATYLVAPRAFTITYQVGETKDGNTPTEAPKAQLQAELDKMEVTNTVPSGTDLAKAPHLKNYQVLAADSGKNPDYYIVDAPDFKLNNPGPYVKVTVGEKAQWWRFDGWSFGVNGSVGDDPKNVTIDLKTKHPDAYTTGNLIFNAKWSRVDDEPGTPDDPDNPPHTNVKSLSVSKAVDSATVGVTAPTDTGFSFTATLSTGTFTGDMLMYKVDKDGKVGEDLLADTFVPSNSVTFTLQAGERMEFDGIPAGVKVTVKENTSGPEFQPASKNYWTVNGATTNVAELEATAPDITDPNAQTASAAFTNYYHATTWLDTDPSTPVNPTDGTGADGFLVLKHLLENDVRRNFFGGNDYTIIVRRGTQSPATTPIPNKAHPDDTEGSVALTSVAGKNEITKKFDTVRFDQPGTYYYVFREARPDGEGVPGVSYDNTRYRVTVVVSAAGSELTATVTHLQRLKGENDGPDGAWQTVLGSAAGTEAISLANQLLFQNTYNPLESKRTFMPRKELEGRGDDRPMTENEFFFTLTAAGSHAMSSEEATRYHAVTGTDEQKAEDRLAILNGLTTWKDNDPGQPMPSNVDEKGKIGNGPTGAIPFAPITYTKDDMGGEPYGKVYKYTLKEDLPTGAVDGKYQGITYDQGTRTLYIYVHLHKAADKTLAVLGDSDTLVYADVYGDRNSIFKNTYSAAPANVDLGGDEDGTGGTGNSTIGLSKTITGRSFQSGDAFTFSITAKTEGAPMPKNAEGTDVKQVTIKPTTGSHTNVSFGTITFDKTGTYVYELQEVKPDPAGANMTYDTAAKTLTVTVTDENGQLKASVDNPIKWTNTYKKPSTPTPTPTPGGSSGGHHSGGGYSKPSTPAKLDTSDHFAYILGKSDGLVHPEANITRAEVATIFYRLLTEDSRRELWTRENPYPDVPSSMWCNIAVSVMSNAGVIKGRVNGKFDPYANITRGEFAAIAARFLSEPYEGEDYYADISTHWAREYINRAAAAGWVKNFDRPFRPNDKITRAEVMSLVNAMIGRAPDKDHMHEDMIQWPDNMDTTQWYYEDVQEATNSHEYVRIKSARESWTKILPVRDWNAIEKEWANLYDAVNPGDVTDISKRG